MKRTVLLLSLVPFLLFLACQTAPSAKKPEAQVAQNGNSQHNQATATSESGDENAVVAQFDTVTITKQTFRQTKSEIELVVEDLNKITYSKDYTRWQTYLSDEYRANFSDPAVLEKVSASLPTKGIKISTLKDYFTYVFVPSRQNMRVDDITFVSPTRVYVIMDLTKDSPAAIYILEKMNGSWKLVPKNSKGAAPD
ncbi:MAG TPA: hypothetical protein PK542_03950 [Treponemataceae bacterium]|nr:hypothetical protein [Treponemataceae bacterium]HPS43620.1 hypothetical protein [Treponemataceae bacterium]